MSKSSLFSEDTVKFSALQSVKASNSKAQDVKKDVTKGRRTIQRGLDVLKDKGIIERKGGKRYGYWEVYEWLLYSYRTIPRWKCNTEISAESGITAANCFVYKII